ncbi:type II toxin-antitoxin system HipA family toxin [Azospirillum sp. RWY-5-1]|uniref:Type II toxin-antitoxin system HipA family toxin n=1 Tax=Azospirillum oleiclasticum TaxID=2735135 RepID=A0ABX2TMF4_9PROT|nr:HipA domain-containing protein [Azospirillum oleiclasticum]NYZ17925.1 type II toxin-antitoxin system HipA family toxin [Azospirillum oleiclasticum]NYZ24607.1 type II toxin-antitoxin system HipA family toxin [Azospirillum oleiclasticum]
MPAPLTVTLQIHHAGAWRDAATVAFLEPERGIAGATRVAYEDGHVFDHAPEALADGPPVVDRRALSVRLPVDFTVHRLEGWPAFLLDLMPQGHARLRLAQALGLPPDGPATELPLLLRAGGSPIGNLRIREAWEEERRRLAGVDCPPLTDADLADQSDRFREVVDRFALLASGSSGVQGEWPKALMTRRASDGRWYPAPFVEGDDAAEHVIVKLLRSTDEGDRLILAAEAPYLEVARTFGLRVAAPLRVHGGALVIPRFDRGTRDGRVLRHGQESLVSAIGVPRFGHLGHHEEYLAAIRAFSGRPAEDTVEYVLRDLLNAAMGNPDNHGRNTALHKPAGGGIELAPLFDFAPMRLAPAGVGRSTRWRCLNGRDHEPDWGIICEAAAFDGLPAATLRQTLCEKAAFLAELPRIAAGHGVPPVVIGRACAGHAAAAAAVGRL